ncbi:SMI1/KNR4 family protein [Thermoactinomyces mirandus]|uniref:SMI1/KNR4 family protein n=1 Tax=Thermoactinomyces mirandus TaxID=2756294 RepID=A0A7W1XS06_9BACL|nr:SMI1/KNR4 family protein [Thermoactinomyces mirandus]MBA4602070.1 SMI1/KNR4 family protein [Thermoactinomyces mirandus]
MGDQLEWRRCQKPTDINSIRKVESYFGIRFPEKFIEVTLKCHSGTVLPNAFYVEDRGDVVLNDFLSFDPEDDLYIIQTYKNIKDRLIENIYPFVNDASGDCLCFDYREGDIEPKVVLWDHEEAFLDKEKGIFPVCDSFEELLLLLENEGY